MEEGTTTIEATAGQTAAEVDTPAITAVESIPEIRAEIETAPAEAEAEAPGMEAQIDTAEPIAAISAPEGESVDAATTDITLTPPVDSEASSCLMDACSPTNLLWVVVVVVIGAILIKLLRKGKSANPAKGPAKSGRDDVVEIYVGNLSYDMTDAQLRREFERFGVIKSARVITHRTNNKSKGYGFVEMPHRKEAMIAIKAIDNSEVLGRRIRANEARANTRPSDK